MDLTEMLKNAKALGLMGVCIVHQGGSTTPYLAACMSRDGDVCDPRNYDTHASPESAVKDLGRKLENLVELKAKRQTAAVA